MSRHPAELKFRQHLKRTGGTCELCAELGGELLSLYLYFIDRNPKNLSDDNLVILCPSCSKIFNQSNPEGLDPNRGLFAFAINRNLYNSFFQHLQLQSLRSIGNEPVLSDQWELPARDQSPPSGKPKRRALNKKELSGKPKDYTRKRETTVSTKTLKARATHKAN